MIIIPDVHGRTFWKEAVTKAEPEEKIVFLGDYLDPYSHENITPIQALDNFKEILKYIKDHSETTIALLGNHDCMTYLSEEMGDCRTDFMNAPIIRNLFLDNLDLFKVAWVSKDIAGKKYIFSHSALLPGWVKDNCQDGIRRKSFFNQTDTVEDIVGALNWTLKRSQDSLWYVLGQVGWARWGWADYGSIVWADLSEVPREDNWPGYYMVFGHSQQESEPVITDYWACLDVRKAFRLDEKNNKIIEL